MSFVLWSLALYPIIVQPGNMTYKDDIKIKSKDSQNLKSPTDSYVLIVWFIHTEFGICALIVC